MAYMVLLGTELGLRDGTQIAIKGVVDKLKGKVKKVSSSPRSLWSRLPRS